MEKLLIKDYLVSKNNYSVLAQENIRGLLKTDFKDYANLGSYYDSEDYISHTDSKVSIFDKTYQLAKQINLKSKYKLITKEYPKKGIILDYGCGVGDFLQYFKNRNWEVLGLEPDPSARIIAGKKLNNSIFDLDYLDEIPGKSIDIISLWHVLEHIPNYAEVLNKLKSKLKKGGLLIIAVPNYESYDASFYKEKWAAWDVPRHLWHFNKSSMKIILSNLNLNLVNINNMYLDAYYVSLLSEKYKSNKLGLLSAFFIASYSNIKGFKNKNCSSLIYISLNK